ncbi:MAG: DJ-1/PfpI family protein [Deltaproteobacteria bacterium]|nr:DJ-1/PfpI family protein [Deltaproteobacteria bacterium]
MSRILVPLPDHDFDVTEVSVPWRVLTDAGHEVVFATEAGAVPAADPRLLTGVLFGKLGAAPDALACYGALVEDAAFRAPTRWDAIDAAAFDALLLPGGHAPGMRQYLGSELLQAKVAAFWATGKPVAAICHGVLVLARAKGADGRSVLHGVETTCLPKYMERTAFFLTFWKLGRYYRTYPAYVEDEVKGALADPQADFRRGPRTLTARGTADDDGPAFVVESRGGRYVSARWPGDAWLLAKRLLALL